MAIGYSIIPIDKQQLSDKKMVDFWANQMVFMPENLPPGRFPTLVELRRIINELGYELKEAHDWHVTSDDNYITIWFNDENRQEDHQIGFWFRRGEIIVLDLMQTIVNHFGRSISS